MKLQQIHELVSRGAAVQAAADAVIEKARADAEAAPKPKGKRGGRRPNQRGRPRELKDPLSRTFTLERAEHARIEAFARRRGESLGTAARAIVAAGLDALGG
jgi:hypothetical protein